MYKTCSGVSAGEILHCSDCCNPYCTCELLSVHISVSKALFSPLMPQFPKGSSVLSTLRETTQRDMLRDLETECGVLGEPRFKSFSWLQLQLILLCLKVCSAVQGSPNKKKRENEPSLY